MAAEKPADKMQDADFDFQGSVKIEPHAFERWDEIEEPEGPEMPEGPEPEPVEFAKIAKTASGGDAPRKPLPPASPPSAELKAAQEARAKAFQEKMAARGGSYADKDDDEPKQPPKKPVPPQVRKRGMERAETPFAAPTPEELNAAKMARLASGRPGAGNEDEDEEYMGKDSKSGPMAESGFEPFHETEDGPPPPNFDDHEHFTGRGEDGEEDDDDDDGGDADPVVIAGDVSGEIMHAIQSLRESAEEMREWTDDAKIDRTETMALRSAIHQDAKAELHAVASTIAQATEAAVSRIELSTDRQAKARSQSDAETKALAAEVRTLLAELRAERAEGKKLRSELAAAIEALRNVSQVKRESLWDKIALNVIISVSTAFLTAMFMGHNPLPAAMPSETPAFLTPAPIPMQPRR